MRHAIPRVSGGVVGDAVLIDGLTALDTDTADDVTAFTQAIERANAHLSTPFEEPLEAIVNAVEPATRYIRSERCCCMSS